MVRSRRDDPPARPHFVLTGTFNSLNRGDCAMQLVAARHLRARWPDASVAIHAPYPEDDQPLYADYELVACSRRRPLRALLAIAQAGLGRLVGGRILRSPELRSYRHATAVIDVSGDCLTETFGWRCPVSHTVPLILARLSGTPFCLLAQTIGPFGRLEPWFRQVLGRAAFITARDEETARYLRGWRLACPLERTADLAFLLEPAPEETASNRLRRLGDYEPERPLIGVTPSNLYNIRGTRHRHIESAAEHTHRLLAEACRRLADAVGGQVAIIPHVFGPGEPYDDRRAADRVAASIGGDTPCLVLREALGSPELKALIGRCDVFVGMRMHSVIAALSQAVPTLSVAYSPKAVHLMARVGLSQFAVDLTTPAGGDLPARLQKLWQERTAVSQTLKSKLDEDLLPAARRNLDLLDDWIAKRIAPAG